MKAIEWMPFLGDDFWESERVAGLDDSGVALYLWLLWRQFKNESLPGPEVLRTLPHRWQRNWGKVWPQVAPCFEVGADGRLRNQVCAEHRSAMLERVESARTNGRKGGRPPKPDQNPPVISGEPPGSIPLTQAKAPNGSYLNGTDQTGSEKNGAPPRADPPPAAEVETWAKTFHEFPTLDQPACHAAYRRWGDYRRTSKLKAWGAPTLKAALGKFEPHGAASLVSAIDESISNGWQGLFPPRNGTANTAPGQSMRAVFAARGAARPTAEEVHHEDVR